MFDPVLILLRNGNSFGCYGPVDRADALDLMDDGTLDEYDYWKIVSYMAVLHSKGKRVAIADKGNLLELEREAKMKGKGE